MDVAFTDRVNHQISLPKQNVEKHVVEYFPSLVRFAKRFIHRVFRSIASHYFLKPIFSSSIILFLWLVKICLIHDFNSYSLAEFVHAVYLFIYHNNFMSSLLTTLHSNLKPQTRKSQPFRFNETLPLKTQWKSFNLRLDNEFKTYALSFINNFFLSRGSCVLMMSQCRSCSNKGDLFLNEKNSTTLVCPLWGALFLCTLSPSKQFLSCVCNLFTPLWGVKYLVLC